MFAEPSQKSAELLQRLRAFFDQHIYPNEERYHREMGMRSAARAVPGRWCH
jgi:acyl-CoA dehydrogenase